MRELATGEVEVQREDGRDWLVVPVGGERGRVSAVVRRVDETGLEVVDVEVRRPSLDDVFFELTGRGTGDGG